MVNHVGRMKPIYGDAPEMDYREHMATQAEISSAAEDYALQEHDEKEVESDDQETPENVQQQAPEAPQEAEQTSV